MPTDTTVKYLHGGMSGAPQLTNTAGSMIALLDALLINGFTLQTVDGVVIAGGIATVTRGAGHPMESSAVALIAGATVTGGSINGEHKVISATATTYTFDATGIADQTATGTITHKLAPAGGPSAYWSKAFTGTNLAAYKSTDPTATGNYLRVDDTGTTTCRVVGYETMSDVNTGTNAFPSAAQISGGGYWAKNNDGTQRTWTFVGDAAGFILYVQHATSGTLTVGTTFMFGDILAEKSPDAYRCTLSCASAAPSTSNVTTGDLVYVAANVNQYFPRNWTGLGSSAQAKRNANSLSETVSAGQYSGNAGMPFPNPANNGLYLSPVYIGENATTAYRGVIPGLYFAPHTGLVGVFPQRTEISSVAGYSGKKFKALNNGTGAAFVDVTGPWR